MLALTGCVLDIFKMDPNYIENEEKYKSIKAEILGEDSEEEGSDSGSEEESGDEDEEGRWYDPHLSIKS
jgi:pre-mRNA-splicing factor CWC22